jgi:hypothetical protein
MVKRDMYQQETKRQDAIVAQSFTVELRLRQDTDEVLGRLLAAVLEHVAKDGDHARSPIHGGPILGLDGTAFLVRDHLCRGPGSRW